MRSSTRTQSIAGRYQITGRLGGGGMGEVLRARDMVLNRTVAIKVLPADLAIDSHFVERFRAEAQAAARVSHRNVVQVHDWGESEDTYYMVMEYVRGRNLREILATRNKLEPRQAAEIVVQLLDALRASHSQGLVHRDVKPENVIVGIDGIVKVTDFGIARLTENAAVTGNMFGTVAYLPPEHARGEDVDARSDIYSVGCVLYELLTGERPFAGDVASILNQHLNSRVPSPSVWPDLDRIVTKATEPAPQDRFQDAGEMADQISELIPYLPPAGELRGLTDELTSEVSAEALATALELPRRKRGLKRWLIGLLVLGLLAAAGFFFKPMRIPDVVGTDRRKATAQLERSGLEVEVRHTFSSDHPAGEVIAMRPNEGALVVRGTKVVLTISRGPQLADLPDLVGMNIDRAKEILKDTGFTLGEVDERHDKTATGTVIEQTPQPGRVRRGEPVNLVVSSGPEMVDVPDVKGKLLGEAEKVLQQAGLGTAREDVFNDAPAGTVIDQAPASGTKVEKGTSVKLVVSKGPEPFAMPDVKGKACADAKSQLQGMGLKIVVLDSRGQSASCGTNKVLEQDPLSGSTVRKGQEATLYVS